MIDQLEVKGYAVVWDKFNTIDEFFAKTYLKEGWFPGVLEQDDKILAKNIEIDVINRPFPGLLTDSEYGAKKILELLNGVCKNVRETFAGDFVITISRSIRNWKIYVTAEAYKLNM